MIIGACEDTSSSGRYFPIGDDADRPRGSARSTLLQTQRSDSSNRSSMASTAFVAEESEPIFSDPPDESKPTVETFRIHTQTHNIIEYGWKAGFGTQRPLQDLRQIA